MSWFSRFERWVNGLEPIIWGTHGGGWRSWLNHALIAAGVAFPFWFIGFDHWAATVMAVFYVVREILQALKTTAKVWSVDRVMDCVGPILVCVLAWTLGG